MSELQQVVKRPAIPWAKVGKRVAEKTGVPPPHISTIHRWRLSGSRGVVLPTFLVGGRRFVREEDLDAFLKAINGEG